MTEKYMELKDGLHPLPNLVSPWLRWNEVSESWTEDGGGGWVCEDLHLVWWDCVDPRTDEICFEASETCFGKESCVHMAPIKQPIDGVPCHWYFEKESKYCLYLLSSFMRRAYYRHKEHITVNVRRKR